MAKRDFGFHLDTGRQSRCNTGIYGGHAKKFLLLITNIFKLESIKYGKHKIIGMLFRAWNFAGFFLHNVNFLQGLVVKELHILNVQKPIFSIGHKLRNLLDFKA